MNRNGRPQIVTRLSQTVKTRLEAEAEKWDMTLTGYIHHILWEHVRALEIKELPPIPTQGMPKFVAYGN